MVTALYRRYRPEAFAEMIGQSQVTEPLMTALRSGRIGHAYLFSGPRGCGKTTSARILARCLNCAEGPTDTPCGVCPSCVELSRDGGGSLDVVEIDAASHGGVDDARDLRERAVFAPARDRYKIFIIDEAHMVTPGGFNALLKIVEEPPPHVKFVFATTEPDKVIGTIRSRTHHYPFRLIAPATLIDYVQSLCDSEGVQVEPGVLPLVVRAGGGSVRDTLSILDQLIAGSEDGMVTASRAAGLLGFTHAELLDDVVAAFGANDAAAAFRATDRVVQTGQDPRRFVEDLLERLRDLIVVSATSVQGAAAVFRGVPEDQLQRMFEQAQDFGAGELSRIADTVSAALDKMTGATAPRLQLELMVARALVQAAAVPAGPATRPVGGSGAQAAAGTDAARPSPQRAAPRSGEDRGQKQGRAPENAGDPLAALAEARSAATAQQARGESGQPQSGQPQPGQPRGEQTAPPVAKPNAAETAASVREFLRGDAAGTPTASTGEPAGRPADSAQERAGGREEPTAERSPDGASTASAEPGERGPAATGGSSPHPNAGAASFGRPISDVLSSAQLESMGNEGARSAPAQPAQAELDAQTGSAASQPEAEPRSEPGAPTATGSEERPEAPSRESQSTQDAGDSVRSSGRQEGAPLDFDELGEMWPDLLGELLENDREAWNAVKVATPLALQGDVLVIGFASAADKDAFKLSGADALREAVLGAFGTQLRFLPKPMPAQGSAAASPAQQPGGAREPGSRPSPAGSEQPAPAEEPGPGGSRDTDDPVARAQARIAAMSGAAKPGTPTRTAAEDAASSKPAVVPDPELLRTESPKGVERPATSAAPVSPPVVPDGPDPDRGTAPRNGATPDPYDGYEPAFSDDEDPYGEQADDPYLSTGASRGEADVEPARDSPGQSSAPASNVRTDRVPGDVSVATEAVSSEARAQETPEVQEVQEAPATAASETTGPAAATSTAVATEPAEATGTAAATADPRPSEEPESVKRAPAFTRYGEAVVREVLGAKFIEELPLPDNREV